MDLKEFISNSLTQIVEGIRDAQARNVDSGAWISPMGENMPHREGAHQISSVAGNQYLDEVKFDVAISVTEEKSGGAKGSLKIMTVSIDAGGNLETQRGAVSRIQFSVPLVWPGSTNDERQKKILENRAKQEEVKRSVSRRVGGRNSWMRN